MVSVQVYVLVCVLVCVLIYVLKVFMLMYAFVCTIGEVRICTVLVYMYQCVYKVVYVLIGLCTCVGTVFHWCSTCKAGVRGDVCDGRFRVLGAANTAGIRDTVIDGLYAGEYARYYYVLSAVFNVVSGVCIYTFV